MSVYSSLNESTIDCKVEIKQSNVHGVGVFATTDIKIGDIVCFYRGRLFHYQSKMSNIDQLLTETNDDIKFITKHMMYATIVHSIHYDNEGDSKVTLYGFLADEITDPRDAGSLINDKPEPELFKSSGCCDKNGFSKIDNAYNVEPMFSIRKYRIGKRLWKHRTPLNAMIARRNIKKGEEIFTRYGHPYWEMYKRQTDLFSQKPYNVYDSWYDFLIDADRHGQMRTWLEECAEERRIKELRRLIFE